VTTAASAVEKYVRQGFSRVIKSQWAANHRIFRPLGLPLEHDVSFIGQPHSNRRELVERLRAVGLRVVTRGFGWPEGRASLREMVVISNQSRVCMNFSNASIGRENQIKGRDFEIPAMGRPMLTAASAELGEYYSDDEIAVYRDADELVELARNLVADEDRRETLAKAGHTRFMADHTAERRLGDLLREIARAGWLRAG
jgi:spore maturation protein CgeB